MFLSGDILDIHTISKDILLIIYLFFHCCVLLNIAVSQISFFTWVKPRNLIYQEKMSIGNYCFRCMSIGHTIFLYKYTSISYYTHIAIYTHSHIDIPMTYHQIIGGEETKSAPLLLGLCAIVWQVYISNVCICNHKKVYFVMSRTNFFPNQITLYTIQ